MSILPLLMRFPGSRRCRSLAKACQEHMHRLFRPYRPELNYMRGPGPKWREKNGAGSKR
jgi:hypothetical protein